MCPCGNSSSSKDCHVANLAKTKNSKKKTLIPSYGCLGTTHETMLKGFNGLMLRNMTNGIEHHITN